MCKHCIMKMCGKSLRKEWWKSSGNNMVKLWKIYIKNMGIVWKTPLCVWENTLRSMETFRSAYGILAWKTVIERMRGKATFGLWKYFLRSMVINRGTRS